MSDCGATLMLSRARRDGRATLSPHRRPNHHNPCPRFIHASCFMHPPLEPRAVRLLRLRRRPGRSVWHRFGSCSQTWVSHVTDELLVLARP